MKNVLAALVLAIGLSLSGCSANSLPVGTTTAQVLDRPACEPTLTGASVEPDVNSVRWVLVKEGFELRPTEHTKILGGELYDTRLDDKVPVPFEVVNPGFGARIRFSYRTFPIVDGVRLCVVRAP